MAEETGKKRTQRTRIRRAEREMRAQAISHLKDGLKHFRGRALLADEVGLGKTMEDGMVLKEYMLRGLVKRALILAPASLVSQWQEEMQSKFDLVFTTTDSPLYHRDSAETPWKCCCRRS